jgi:hypothetical protein
MALGWLGSELGENASSARTRGRRGVTFAIDGVVKLFDQEGGFVV